MQNTRAHIDYVHFNPGKHGIVRRVADSPYSTFHRLVERSVYRRDWGGGKDQTWAYGD